MPRKAIPAETLVDLRRRLLMLPSRSAARRRVVQETAALYGVSEYTLYRTLREVRHPHPAQRADRGIPRVLPPAELERYCEMIAALKIKTSNRDQRAHSNRKVRFHSA
jgi:hypothetical protein